MLDTPKRQHLGPRGEYVSGWTDKELPMEAGSLIDSVSPHRFVDMTVGLGGSQCLLCFGWSDDARHYLPQYWQYVDDAVCARYEDRKEWQILTSR